MRKKLAPATLVAMFVVTSVYAQKSSGPTKGTLIVTGGGFGTGVKERFCILGRWPRL